MTTEHSPYTGRPIVDWFQEPYRLHDVDRDVVGDIVEIYPDFVVVETDGGFLGLGDRRTYYVPRTDVTEAEGSDWYLRIDKDDLEAMGWTAPPATSEFATEDWQARYGYQAPPGETGRMRMVRFEEDLGATKVERQVGEVTVRKDVEEEVETVEVPVRREEVHVERRPVTDPATATNEAGDTAFRSTEQEIRVPVMKEEVEVRKVVRPVEEVVVSKDTREETRVVSDTVRKERFDIEDNADTAEDAVVEHKGG